MSGASMDGEESRSRLTSEDAVSSEDARRREGDVAQFVAAAQPEMMRAEEKDEQYVGQICDACYEAFRHTFGTRHAVAYQNEIKLTGRVLYFLLTTGSGLQTLGEEYCDIVQVAGLPGIPASPARRALLGFYQTVLPYLSERLSARAASRGMALANDEVQSTTSALASDHLGSSSSATETFQVERRLGRRVMDSLQRAWLAGLRRWPQMLPAIREGSVLLLRTHLMLFYFEGLYYHLAKRGAGIRYVFTGRVNQQRPRYQILGMFLLVQLTLVCGDWLTRTVFPSIAYSVRSRAADLTLSSGAHGIIVLDDDGQVPQKASNTQPFVKGEVETPSSKCPLCLSTRQHPTATPCGHVFCWNCVAEWCNEKPECPLCRAPITHSELVCVYHADF